MMFVAQLHLNYRLQSTSFHISAKKGLSNKRFQFEPQLLPYALETNYAYILFVRVNFLENLYSCVRSIYVWCIQASYIYSKPMLNALLHHMSCNAYVNLGNKLFNTAIFINDMTTCMNEMQHGLLEQNRFKHSSVIFTNILLAN